MRRGYRGAEHETAPTTGRQTLNSFPRLAIDPSGMVYLTFRTRLFPGRTPAGSVWAEQMVYFDGMHGRVRSKFPTRTNGSTTGPPWP